MKRSVFIVLLVVIWLGTQMVQGAAGTTTISEGKEFGKFSITMVETTATKIGFNLKAVVYPNPPVEIRLTLLTQTPKDWTYCLVTQGGSSELYPIATGVARYEVFPENGPIILEKSPGPVISRSSPVHASSQSYPAKYANDNDYSNTWWGYVPGWIAYDLSRVPMAQRSKVVVAWYTEGIKDYDHTLVYGEAFFRSSSCLAYPNTRIMVKIVCLERWFCYGFDGGLAVG